MSDNSGTIKTGAPGAKPASLWAQIIAAVWIAGWSAFKFARAPEAIDMIDVMLSGVTIAACFIPVYFSIILDKIKEIKLGGSK